MASTSCSEEWSKYTLIIVNSLLFLAAAVSLLVCIFLFYDNLSSAITGFNLLTLVACTTIPLMIFSCIGCRFANKPRNIRGELKQRDYVYLGFLVALFVTATILAIVLWNVNGSLKEAKEAVIYNAGSGVTAVLHLMHRQLQEFYFKKKCVGGEANSTTIPLEFGRVECIRSEARAGAINALFRKHVISSPIEFDRYKNCTLDPSFTAVGQKPSGFTQAFCGAEENILAFAMRYSSYLMWCPLGLVVVLSIVLVATLCIVCDSTEENPSNQQELVKH